MVEEDIEHNYLYKKIESIEHRLESHVTKIEQRLDQLVHIMGAVASLQERETRNADSIKELRNSLKDSFDKFDRAVERIHGRLDSINKSMDTDLMKHSEYRTDLDTKINTVNNEVSKWRERGFGLWVGVSLLVLTLQILGGYIIKSTADDYKVTKNQVVEISKIQINHGQELIKLNRAVAPPTP